MKDAYRRSSDGRKGSKSAYILKKKEKEQLQPFLFKIRAVYPSNLIHSESEII